jgi:hypothetical protein
VEATEVKGHGFHLSAIHVYVAAIILSGFTRGADIPKAPVPKSPFMPVLYGYAEAMLKNGRDIYGPEKTGMFLSALDRITLAPLTNRPSPPRGVPEERRAGAKNQPLVGANPQHDHNLLRLLYTLSELSGKGHYRAAADAELKWFLENARSTNTNLLPWGDYLSWDVMNDQPVAGDGAKEGGHRFSRPWMLWDRCFAVAPDASKQFARALQNVRIDSPRDAGFYIRAWAAAYAHTKDEQFLGLIEVLLKRFEQGRETNSRTDWTLSMAIDCDGAAHHVPETLASRLRASADREDKVFCSLPHNVKTSGGFLISLPQASDKGATASTQRWNPDADVTTAQMGVMCVSRYDNTGKTGYRDLIFAAADAYLDSMPRDDEDAWPLTFGHAISLEVAAWRHSANSKYMERARQLGEFALEKFWGTNALPRASLKTGHYESITGADTLALALLELHLNILHITAVRCPPVR